MAAPQVLDPPAGAAASSAVVWINSRRAVMASMSGDGRISTCEIDRGWLSQSSYLQVVVRVMGDHQRLVILGPGKVRLALEREYVAIYRRLGRLIDVEPAGPVSSEQLVDRLRTLAA